MSDIQIISGRPPIKGNEVNVSLSSGLATESTLTAIKDTDGIKKINDSLPTGSNIIGKVSIDQTTPGTTNATYITNTMTTGQAVSANSFPTVLSTEQETILSSIKTAVEKIDDAISGSEMQVDVVASLPAGTNAIGKLAANSGVDIGDVDVTSISAGSNLIGDVGIQPRTSGGLTIFRSIDLDESEEEVKGSAGQVFGYYIFNAATSTRFVKFYNATAANVTVGTTTPVLTIPIPAGSAANLLSPIGITFDTAITAAATTAVADNDTGAPGANEVVINVFYK